ncbi:hypothetical protein EVAR_19605_1 [Eumeta japonica]|uniref:Reverse transcriptase domain-containing protein n=1 Tax=Eumeta variegata TaxID=151549 RepID=A0A4C1UGS7_EUMVA|nr:hypothetical protein EVAR_19605_1 [Eumeta japonica]
MSLDRAVTTTPIPIRFRCSIVLDPVLDITRGHCTRNPEGVTSALPPLSCLYDLKEYDSGLRLDESSLKCLLYADNQVILAQSACGLQETLAKFNKCPPDPHIGRKGSGTCRRERGQRAASARRRHHDAAHVAARDAAGTSAVSGELSTNRSISVADARGGGARQFFLSNYRTMWRALRAEAGGPRLIKSEDGPAPPPGARTRPRALPIHQPGRSWATPVAARLRECHSIVYKEVYNFYRNFFLVVKVLLACAGGVAGDSGGI